MWPLMPHTNIIEGLVVLSPLPSLNSGLGPGLGTAVSRARPTQQSDGPPGEEVSAGFREVRSFGHSKGLV